MANRREFMRTLSGVAALSITTDVSQLGRMRFLRMATAMPDMNPHDRLQPDWYRRKIVEVQEKMKERKLNALLLLDATNITYTVQVSTNLASTNWAPLFSLILTNNVYPVMDNQATNSPRYYRVLKN